MAANILLWYEHPNNSPPNKDGCKHRNQRLDYIPKIGNVVYMSQGGRQPLLEYDNHTGMQHICIRLHSRLRCSFLCYTLKTNSHLRQIGNFLSRGLEI